MATSTAADHDRILPRFPTGRLRHARPEHNACHAHQILSSALGNAARRRRTVHAMSSAFAYLSVMVSIVLGLATAHLLGAVARTVNQRREIRFYWPSLVWSAVLFIIILQVWWADFALSQRNDWTFPGFASMLMIPCTLYLMSYLVLPDTPDMKAAFRRNRVWFFSLLIATVVFSSTQQFLVTVHMDFGLDFAFKMFGVAMAILSIVFDSDPAQAFFACVGAVFIVAYVAILFIPLRAS